MRVLLKEQGVWTLLFISASHIERQTNSEADGEKCLVNDPSIAIRRGSL